MRHSLPLAGSLCLALAWPAGAQAPPRPEAALEAQLVLAAYRGDRLSVAEALGRGARLDATDANGYSALHWAAYGGHLALAGDLLAKGAPLEARTRVGQTPLMLAAWQGQAELVELLLARGAQVGATSPQGHSAEAFARRRGHLALAERLAMAARPAPLAWPLHPCWWPVPKPWPAVAQGGGPSSLPGGPGPAPRGLASVAPWPGTALPPSPRPWATAPAPPTPAPHLAPSTAPSPLSWGLPSPSPRPLPSPPPSSPEPWPWTEWLQGEAGPLPWVLGPTIGLHASGVSFPIWGVQVRRGLTQQLAVRAAFEGGGYQQVLGLTPVAFQFQRYHLALLSQGKLYGGVGLTHVVLGSAWEQGSRPANSALDLIVGLRWPWQGAGWALEPSAEFRFGVEGPSTLNLGLATRF